MSIFFDFDVGPSGRRFRRAVEEDKHDIEKFCDRNLTEPLFGEVDIGALIELSTLSICMINASKEVVGFMAFSDHPVQAVIVAADWEIWMRNMFHRFYLSRNTLFIHFMCCTDDVIDYFVQDALVSVFVNDAYLKHIILLVNKDCPSDCYTKFTVFGNNVTYKYNVRRVMDDNSGMYMFAASSKDFCPQLKLRRAVEEDNDEIVEILDKQCKRLRELYGNYYIAELVGHHPETKRKIIVAEQKDRSIAGVMCLNTDINYEKLQRIYDLKQFYGLTKATPLDREMWKRANKLLTTFGEISVAEIIMCLKTDINYEKLHRIYDRKQFYGLTKATPLDREKWKRANKLLATFGDPVMCGKCSPYSPMVKMKNAVHNESFSEKPKQIVKPKTSRVSYKRAVFGPSLDSRNISDTSSKYMLSPSLSVQSYVPSKTVLAMLEEEDPFEFEIVNIDAELIAMPEDLMLNETFADNETEVNITTWPTSTDSGEGPAISGVLQKHDKNVVNSTKKSLRRQSKADEDELPKPVKSRASIAPIQFTGQPNAFMIELFGLQDDVHERHAFNLLEAAFELMKGYEYCIIEIPLEEPAFSLLQHFCYVPSTSDELIETALYVAHRNAIFGKLRVREAEMADIPQISQVLHEVEAKDMIWTVEDTLMSAKENKVYVMMCGSAVIGFGIVEALDQIDYIRTKYLLETYHIHKYHAQRQGMDSGFTTMKTVMVYRVFEPHFRFFARDMMRLYGCNSMLWLTAYRNKWVAYKANILAPMMIPLMPRKNELDYLETIELKRIAALSKTLIPFTAWFLSKKYCSVPVLNVNARIVVVGASRATLAFLDQLLFSESCTYLSFTNVTLISPTSIPHMRKNSHPSGLMFTRNCTNSDKYIKSVPYTYYVNIVNSTLVGIDKLHKYVTVSCGGKIYYDYLCLMFGKQYQPPDYFEDALSKKNRQEHGEPCQYKRLDIPRTVKEDVPITADFLPENVFIVNSYTESARAMNYVFKLASTQANYNCTNVDHKIIVYGATIHAYCCLAALLETNIPTENIVFVEQFPPEDEMEPRVSLFCNEYVDQEIQEVLKNLNITVYRAHYFKDWTVDVNNRVNQVQFISHFKMITIQCSAFFYYGKKGINPEAFVAINKSGIAYNDGILIDHEFRTKNPSVYAAGPATRYYGKYFADHRQHKYYDSYEIGAKFGEIIRNKLDPLFKPSKTKGRQSGREKEVFSDSISSNTNGTSKSSAIEEDTSVVGDIPVLKKPLVTCCQLPGGLQYLDVRPPGKRIPHHYVQSLHYNGYVLETFKKGYFKLHLDSNMVVDGVTCLSPVYNLENFKHLYGKPSNVLNNVYLKFYTKRIDDFYDYFRQAWAQFLYVDSVDELFAMVKELNPKEDSNTSAPTETLITILETGEDLHQLPPLKSRMMERTRPDFRETSQVETIIDYVLEWIDQHDILLPMYLHPSQKPLFMTDMNFHPAFRKKKTRVSKLMKMMFL